MPKYTVCYSIMGSGTIEVEAETPEKAVEIAEGEAYVSVCHQCAREIEDPELYEITGVIDEAGKEVWTAPLKALKEARERELALTVSVANQKPSEALAEEATP